MSLHPNARELTRAIEIAEERAADAYTVESAVRCHSELLDLLAIEAIVIRMSDQSEHEKDAAISEITAKAGYHRDAVDRLTDIIEANQQLIWYP